MATYTYNNFLLSSARRFKVRPEFYRQLDLTESRSHRYKAAMQTPQEQGKEQILYMTNESFKTV
jgi:hypothetical protein